LRGDDAQRAAAQLLPAMNQAGGSEKQVKDAVALLNREANPAAFISEIARTTQLAGGVSLNQRLWTGRRHRVRKDSLVALPREIRLAMEMAAHEESERRALEGELKALELAWQEADEIAAISDDLFVPQAIRDMLAKFRTSG